MFRAILELLITIGVVLLARAVLTSLLKGFTRAASQSFPHNSHAAGGTTPRPGGDLHKDPVCGTYVAESSALKRRADGQTYYYCSQTCYEKHSLVSR
jgi:YHS domain-containing protein